jgi:hypothetical protein
LIIMSSIISVKNPVIDWLQIKSRFNSRQSIVDLIFKIIFRVNAIFMTCFDCIWVILQILYNRYYSKIWLSIEK